MVRIINTEEKKLNELISKYNHADIVGRRNVIALSDLHSIPWLNVITEIDISLVFNERYLLRLLTWQTEQDSCMSYYKIQWGIQDENIIISRIKYEVENTHGGPSRNTAYPNKKATCSLIIRVIKNNTEAIKNIREEQEIIALHGNAGGERKICSEAQEAKIANATESIISLIESRLGFKL